MKLYNDLGYCEVVDHRLDDRHSYGSSALKGIEEDTKLIRYLMSHRHTSPFEQASITFSLRMPIFVMRQFVRHRTFRLNEESARYTEMRDDFYIPTKWRLQDKDNKQGSVGHHELSDEITHDVRAVVKHATACYIAMLRNGVAKEMARMVLPVNLMTTIVVNIDLHNLMGFFVLRLDNHAQLEIRQLASAMYAEFDKLYPVVSGAFKELVLDPKNIKIDHE